MWFRFRFKIHFITAVVLCLGGGIGEISSLVSLFYVNAMYIAVFERQVNKCSPVATTSSPSTLRLAPRFSRAVTPFGQSIECSRPHTLCFSYEYYSLTLLFSEGLQGLVGYLTRNQHPPVDQFALDVVVLVGILDQ